MTVVRRMTLATALAAVLAPVGWAQDQSGKQADLPKSILLARSWDDAMKEAQIRNVPIFFSTILAT